MQRSEEEKGRTRPLVAALVAAALLVPVTAFAAGISMTSESFIVGPGPADAGEAKCGSGRTAISGGFETQFDRGDSASPAIAVVSFRRDRNSWFSEGSAINGQPGALTVYAYCAKADVRSSFVASELAGGATGNAEARCSRGDLAVAGGFVGEQNIGPGLTRVIAHGLRRVSRSAWRVSAGNIGANPGGLTAYVVCASGELGNTRLKQIRTRQTLAIPPDGLGATATAVARCAQGQRVVAGGFEAPPFATGVVVHASRRQGERRWVVEASSQTASTGTVTSFAYCAAA